MSLQKKVFPAYFGAETALTLATAVTYPAGSLLALSGNSLDLTLLGVSLGMSGLNLLVYGPRTTNAMQARNHQETRENLKLGASAELSKDKCSAEMYKAKRLFSFNHAMSIHLNLLGLFATIAYGLSLSSRLSFA